MSNPLQFFLHPAKGPASLFLIRLPVGLIFLTQGILKFIDQHGSGAIHAHQDSDPYFTAHFVGCFEIVCGLILFGLWTRTASVPSVIVISTAIATTKLPELFDPTQGFWEMVSDARTDFAVFCCLLLILHGGGAWALDAEAEAEPRRGPSEMRNF